jgi:hypothetical protein
LNDQLETRSHSMPNDLIPMGVPLQFILLTPKDLLPYAQWPDTSLQV